MDQHWILELAEPDPDKLLSMSDEEFRSAMSDAGLDVDELAEQFYLSVRELISTFRNEKDG